MTEDNHSEIFEHHRDRLEPGRHWLGLPVVRPTVGTIRDVLNAVPHFGRQPFAMASPNGDDVGVNSFLEVVYHVEAASTAHTLIQTIQKDGPSAYGLEPTCHFGRHELERVNGQCPVAEDR